jgi:multicomponent Na+:H+ antiporter subunit F
MVSALITSGCLIPCAWTCLRGSAERRLIGLEMTTVIVILLLALLSVGEGRLVFFDLPLTLALLAFGASLVFARFLEKHL